MPLRLFLAGAARRLSSSSSTTSITSVRRRRSDKRLLPPPPSDADLPDPHSLLNSADPIETCASIWLRAFSRRNPNPFANLSGFLSRFDLWLLAYQRSCAAATGSFPAASAVSPSALRGLLLLRRAAVARSPPFSWGAADYLLVRSPADPPATRRRRVAESAPPPFQDRVVQELLLLLLEPVFEPRFSPKSHAFRPGRSPHSALRSIRAGFASYLWFIKADLTAVTDGLSPDVIISCVEKFIGDRKVLALLQSALRTPVLAPSLPEDEPDSLMKKRLKRKVLRQSRRKKRLNANEPKPDPYWLRLFFGFAPEEARHTPNYGHCGILSPLLANVCLNELDQWLEDRIADYCRSSFDDGCHNPLWPEFVPSGEDRNKMRKMDFLRFGSHILIGIRGPREDAVKVRRELIEFCEAKFGLKLENSKVEIDHVTRGIEFLDHEIARRVIYPTLRYTASGGGVVSQKGVGTMLSVKASLRRCMRHLRQLELIKGDRDPEPLPCSPMLYSGQAHTNAQMNKFLETMADWYMYADNRKKIVGFISYIIRSSLAKLYAARYRLKSRAKVYGIASRNLSLPLKESSRNNAPEYSDLIRMGVTDIIEGVQFSRMSSVPSCDYTPLPRRWMPFHELALREHIKLQEPSFFCELHKAIRRRQIGSPQDDVSKLVWSFKVHGVRSVLSSAAAEKSDGPRDDGGAMSSRSSPLHPLLSPPSVALCG